jgi:hypothetical protein
MPDEVKKDSRKSKLVLSEINKNARIMSVKKIPSPTCVAYLAIESKVVL